MGLFQQTVPSGQRTTSAQNLCFAAALLSLAIQCAAAQSQRSAAVQVPGSVEGIVINKTDGTPLASATVELLGRSQSGSDAVAQRVRYTTQTGMDGRFALKSLPPGTYTLSATLDGYLQPRLAGNPVSALEINDRQNLRNVRIQLVPQSGISGRIVNDSGAVAGITLLLLRFEYDKNGSLGLQPGSNSPGSKTGAKTDSKGEYRIFPIEPGEYFLWIQPAQDFYPLYYPGVPDPESAAKLFVEPGNDLSHIDWHIQSGPRYSIRLMLSETESLQNRTIFQLRSRGRIREQNLLASSSVSHDPTDGSYLIRQIPPGSYDLYIQGGTSENQHVPFDIVDRNIDLGTIANKPRVTISGRIIFQQTASASLKVFIDPFPILNGQQQSISVADDGTFRFESVQDGQYRINVRTIASSGYIVSARLGAVDVLESGMTVDSSVAIPELEIRLGGPSGGVDGTVQNAKGEPVRDARVVVFPLSGPRENPDVFHAGSSNQDGVFSISEIPPGDYGVMAWEYLPGDAYKNAEFLKPYEALATKVLVVSGATSRVIIRSHDALH